MFRNSWRCFNDESMNKKEKVAALVIVIVIVIVMVGNANAQYGQADVPK